VALTGTLARPGTVPTVADDEEEDFFAATPHHAAHSKYVIADDAPVLPSLASRCKVELVVKDDGMSMVLFDKELADIVHWVEYDMDVDSLTFVTWKGAIFSLGLKVARPFRKYLSKRHEIYLIEMENGEKMKMMDLVPLITRRIGI